MDRHVERVYRRIGVQVYLREASSGLSEDDVAGGGGGGGGGGGVVRAAEGVPRGRAARRRARGRRAGAARR